MERETIVYRGKNYHRYPESKRRQHRVYYWRHDKGSPFPLHRQIWIDTNGTIPKGMVIHHKDENPSNNTIENLELLSAGRHVSLHLNTSERIAISRRTFVHAQLAARAWHASNEGKEWHKEHAKKQGLKPKTYQRRCARCGKTFNAYHTETISCSFTCRHYLYMQKRKKNRLQS